MLCKYFQHSFKKKNKKRCEINRLKIIIDITVLRRFKRRYGIKKNNILCTRSF